MDLEMIAEPEFLRLLAFVQREGRLPELAQEALRRFPPEPWWICTAEESQGSPGNPSLAGLDDRM
jgi:hypothetical protein